MSETTCTGTGQKPGLSSRDETSTGVSGTRRWTDQDNVDLWNRKLDALRAELATARAEAERLRGMIASFENIMQDSSEKPIRLCCDSGEGEDHDEDCPFYQWEGDA